MNNLTILMIIGLIIVGIIRIINDIIEYKLRKLMISQVKFDDYIKYIEEREKENE